jgi:hypothetical protein
MEQRARPACGPPSPATATAGIDLLTLQRPLRPMHLHRVAQAGARAALQLLKLRDRRARQQIELR